MKPWLPAAVLVLVSCAAASAQTAAQRHVTTAHALAKYGHFYHGSHVTFLATLTETGGVPITPIGEKQRVAIIWQESHAAEGEALLSGNFFDLGRLEQTDPRLANVDTQKILDALNEGRWPGRDLMFVLLNARASTYEPAVQPDLRAIALDPARFAGKEVTISGRFRGRNLLGDQPLSPGKSQHEYVLRVADASVWVSGLRPRGRGFALDPESRRDTREWVRVTGTVRHEPPLVWVEGEKIEIAKPQAEAEPEKDAPRLPPGPPPEIIFSAPLDGEANVPTAVVLRVQFSRDIDPKSLENQVAAAYALRADGTMPGPPPAATTVYRPANRSIEVRFAEPLAPYTKVVVAFGDGIKATDGIAMKPVRISFTTGR